MRQRYQKHNVRIGIVAQICAQIQWSLTAVVQQIRISCTRVLNKAHQVPKHCIGGKFQNRLHISYARKTVEQREIKQLSNFRCKHWHTSFRVMLSYKTSTITDLHCPNFSEMETFPRSQCFTFTTFFLTWPRQLLAKFAFPTYCKIRISFYTVNKHIILQSSNLF